MSLASTCKVIHPRWLTPLTHWLQCLHPSYHIQNSLVALGDFLVSDVGGPEPAVGEALGEQGGVDAFGAADFADGNAGFRRRRRPDFWTHLEQGVVDERRKRVRRQTAPPLVKVWVSARSFVRLCWGRTAATITTTTTTLMNRQR